MDAGPLRTAIGARLRELRESLGLSQLALARALGSPMIQRAISEYEAGKKAPGAAFLAQLASVTGASVDWLLTGHGERLRDQWAAQSQNPAARKAPQVH